MLFILILEKGSVYNDRDIIIIGVFRNRQDADKCKRKHEGEDYDEEYRSYYLYEVDKTDINVPIERECTYEIEERDRYSLFRQKKEEEEKEEKEERKKIMDANRMKCDNIITNMNDETKIHLHDFIESYKRVCDIINEPNCYQIICNRTQDVWEQLCNSVKYLSRKDRELFGLFYNSIGMVFRHSVNLLR